MPGQFAEENDRGTFRKAKSEVRGSHATWLSPHIHITFACTLHHGLFSLTRHRFRATSCGNGVCCQAELVANTASRIEEMLREQADYEAGNAAAKEEIDDEALEQLVGPLPFPLHLPSLAPPPHSLPQRNQTHSPAHTLPHTPSLTPELGDRPTTGLKKRPWSRRAGLRCDHLTHSPPLPHPRRQHQPLHPSASLPMKASRRFSTACLSRK